MSQRALSRELGISLGAVNYCLKSLVEKGQLKMRDFSAAKSKLRYSYVLTPKGIAKKATLTSRFLQRKLIEYDALKAEIESLQEDLGLGADMGPAPGAHSVARSRK